MNKIWMLVRILLKGGTSGVENSAKKIKSNWWVIPLLIVCFAPMGVMALKGIMVLFDILSVIGQEGIILSLCIGATSVVVMFFGLFYVMSVLYFSNDIETLLPLPLTSYQILSAKFITVLIYEYITMLAIFLPISITWGIKAQAGPVYYLYMLVLFFLIPVVPLIIASLIIMVMMLFGKASRDRDKFKMFVGILALFVGLGINFVIQRFVNGGMTQEQLTNLFMEQNNSLVGITSKVFPGSEFAANAMIRYQIFNGFINLVIFCLIVIAGCILFVLAGQWLYFRGVVGASQTAAKRSQLKNTDYIGKHSGKGKIYAYILKELRIIFRTPIFFINCVLSNLIWPLMIVFMMVVGGDSYKGLIDMLKNIQWEESGTVVVAIGFGFFVFAGSANGVTPSAISREGQCFYINKYLPFDPVKQILSKVLTGILLSCIMIVVAIPIALFVLEMPMVIVLLVVIAGMSGIVMSALLGIIFDIYNPKLDWDNEQRAVKQNMNVVISMFLGLGIGIALAVGAIFLKLNPYLTAFLLVLISSGISYMIFTFIRNTAVKRYIHI